MHSRTEGCLLGMTDVMEIKQSFGVIKMNSDSTDFLLIRLVMQLIVVLGNDCFSVTILVCPARNPILVNLLALCPEEKQSWGSVRGTLRLRGALTSPHSPLSGRAVSCRGRILLCSLSMTMLGVTTEAVETPESWWEPLWNGTHSKHEALKCSGAAWGFWLFLL